MPSLLQRLGTALRLVAPETPESQSNQPQRIQIHTTEVGSSGVAVYSGYYSEEYLNNLRGRPAADIWDHMRRSDPKIRMVLKAVKTPILGAQWSVRPGGQEDQFQKHRDLIEKILFHDLPQSWTQQVSEILTYLDFGVAPFEVIHGVKMADKVFGNYTTLKKLAWRSPRTVERYNLDSATGEMISLTQYAYGDLGRLVDIPGQFLVLFTHEKEGDNYEGVSALRTCYGPWKRKNMYQKLMAIGIEKYAVPTPKMKVPAGKDGTKEYDNAKLVLEKFVSHQQQFILYPEGWDVDFASPSNFDASKIQDAIVRENSEIASAFLVSFLELGQQQSGSWALSTDLSDFALLSISHVADYICEVINAKVIKQLVDMNFGAQDAYPELVCTGITDKPGKEFAEVLKLLVDGKVLTPDADLESYVREKYDLTEPMEAEVSAPAAPTLQPQQVQIPAPSAAVTAVPAQPTQKVGLAEPKIIKADSGDRGLWQTAGDEKVCSECDPLDGEVTSREPPLHDNCRCSKDYEIKSTETVRSHKLQEGTDFALIQIDVSKKLASTQSEAEKLAQEITSLDQSVQRSENEFEYRFTLMDAGLIVEGSLKSFEPMEGMKVMYGKRKVESPTPPAQSSTDSVLN